MKSPWDRERLHGWLGVGCELRLQHDLKRGHIFGADVLRDLNRYKIISIPWDAIDPSNWLWHVEGVPSAFLSQLLWGWDELTMWKGSTLMQVLCKCEPAGSVRDGHCSPDPLCSPDFPSGGLIADGKGVPECLLIWDLPRVHSWMLMGCHVPLGWWFPFGREPSVWVKLWAPLSSGSGVRSLALQAAHRSQGPNNGGNRTQIQPQSHFYLQVST